MIDSLMKNYYRLMANVRLDLTQFKSSGVYTLEFDQTDNIVLNTQTIRLIVGFSNKGIFNAPVYLPDKKTAKRIYGPIDSNLERRGSFFHRALYTCLDVGPVYGLNLMPLNDSVYDGDYTNFQSLSLAFTEPNGDKVRKLLSSFFNKEKFWKASPEYLLANRTSTVNEGKLFNIVNIGSKPISVLVKKSNIQGFDVTAREWYGQGKVPTYIDQWDLVSDYFVEIKILEGDWTDYKKLSEDKTFYQYFDQFGLIKSKANAFYNLPEVNVLGTFTGCILPEFIDGNNVNHSIEDIINSAIAETGLMMAIDVAALEAYDPATSLENDFDNISAVDMVGHKVAMLHVNDLLNDTTSKPNTIKFLSYNLPIDEKVEYSEVSSNSASSVLLSEAADTVSLEDLFIGGKSGYFNNIVKLTPGTDTSKYSRIANLTVPRQSYLIDNNGNRYQIEFIELTQNALNIGYSHDATTTLDYNTIDIDTITLATDPVSLLRTQTIKFKSTINTIDDSGKIIIRNLKTRTYSYYTLDNTDQLVLAESTGAHIIEALTQDTVSNFQVIYLASTNHTISKSVLSNVSIVLDPKTTIKDGNTLIVEAGHQIYKDFVDGILCDGDQLTASNGKYLQYKKARDINRNILKITAYDNYANGAFTGQVSSPAFLVNGKMTIFSSYADNLYDTFIFSKVSSDKKTFAITKAALNYDLSAINLGDYVIAEIDGDDGSVRYKFTKILTKKDIGDAFEFTTVEPIFVETSTSNIIRYRPLDEYAKNYNFFALDGFKITDAHRPSDKNKYPQLNKILGMLDPENSNLMEGLKDRNVIPFRYVIDTFDGGLQPMTGAKRWLTRLAKERQKCLALMNTPSMAEFVKSVSPRFTDLPTAVNPMPILNTRYIVEGGNQLLGLDESNRFSLPDEEWGSKYSGYFAPYFTIVENGKRMNIPPAADVSNLFVLKFLNGYPYSIVAGTKRGVISNPNMIGLEYYFSQKDRDNLEPFGINPIIKQSRYGFMIFGNSMTYQKTLSALNNLHIRDILITIEEAIEDIMTSFLFEFNDAQTRLMLKSRVDAYLDGVRGNGGIYDYAVIMDETNNTSDVIDQNTAILDVAVEPVRGMQKIINRLKILRTGSIQAGGFTIA